MKMKRQYVVQVECKNTCFNLLVRRSIVMLNGLLIQVYRIKYVCRCQSHVLGNTVSEVVVTRRISAINWFSSHLACCRGRK